MVTLTTFESGLNPALAAALPVSEQTPLVFFATSFPLATLQVLVVDETHTNLVPWTVFAGRVKLFFTLSFVAKAFTV
jgi:hypothetical protein